MHGDENCWEKNIFRHETVKDWRVLYMKLLNMLNMFKYENFWKLKIVSGTKIVENWIVLAMKIIENWIVSYMKIVPPEGKIPSDVP